MKLFGKMLAVTDGSGNVLETYTHGADLSGHVGGGAGGIGGILASTQAGGTAYYHYDFNGNIVNVSSTNQTQLAKYTYSPFGEVLLKDGLFDSRYQFSTKEYDSTTGLNYYGYRYYSPGMGRWVSRDPARDLSWAVTARKNPSRGGVYSVGLQQEWNLYHFVRNQPISRFDYLGLADSCDPAWGGLLRTVGDFIEEAGNAVDPLPSCSEDTPLRKAARELLDAYNDMKDANTIGADRYFHCIGMCNAARNCGDKDMVEALGRVREIFDNVKNQLCGDNTALEQAADSFKDMEANRKGINCPEDQSCECCCQEYKVKGL